MEGINMSNTTTTTTTTTDVTTTSSSLQTVVGSDAPSTWNIQRETGPPSILVSRTNENPVQLSGSTQTEAIATIAPPAIAFSGMSNISMKKKRGRPRKYAQDGVVAGALSPEPISSLRPPPVIDFSAEKRGKVRPHGSVHKQYQPRVETESLCDWVSCSVGGSITPHIITVNAGEDVTNKVISFSQQGPRAICILSANGVISSVTLRQPDSSGGTLTYEGRFEILSLSGSFMPSETGGIRNRTGGMSVSLASPDGRVVGGGVAGLLVAASPVQIVVGSFLAGNQLGQNTKKVKSDSINFSPAPTMPLSSPDMDEPYRNSSNWSSVAPDSSNRPTDINANLQGQQADTEYYN
ncbi:hypothetical protein LIER_07236 [Lithospermum erythrorhizon]|uniref:AT-hook motif nuclear-localized protein n=1 Tax=Lithospermum erythrorhizon TaxID=34254 RepID=A0AAV3P8A0_LITER